MICRLLVAKPRNLEMFKMAFQGGFSAKNVQRFGFVPFIAPKLEKQGGHNNGPLGNNVFPNPR